MLKEHELVNEWKSLNVEMLAIFRNFEHCDYLKLWELAMQAIKVAVAAVDLELLPVAMRLEIMSNMYLWVGQKNQRELFSQFEHVYKRSIEIIEKALGDDHLVLVTNLNYLADFYQQQSYLKDKEQLYIRALAISENCLGPHDEVAKCLHNLAAVSEELGKFIEAEIFYKRAIFIQEKTISNTPRSLAFNLNKLAELYSEQNQFDQAENCFKSAVEALQKALGEKDIYTREAMNNLAAFYDNQKLYELAEPIYLKTGADIELANLYTAQKKYGLAEPLIKSQLKFYEEISEDSAPGPGKNYWIGMTLIELGNFYFVQDLFSQAEASYARAIELLGTEDMTVLPILENLITIYQKDNRTAEANAFMITADLLRKEKSEFEEDLELLAIAKERENDSALKVNLNDL